MGCGIITYVQRKIYLYNVTFGLYMLDWWERYLFNTLIVVLLWFICYNGSRSAAELYRRITISSPSIFLFMLFFLGRH